MNDPTITAIPVTVVSQASLDALLGELTALRGCVGDMLLAFGARDGLTRDLSAEDLRETFERHGIMFSMDASYYRFGPLGVVCLMAANERVNQRVN